MRESAVMFDQARTAALSSDNAHGVVEQYPARRDGGKKRPQSRQLLSCTKCRDRKVKCDRTEPCSACCAHGQPKECHFVAEDGNYAPIKQSYEIRKLREEVKEVHRLREENRRLEERLRASKNWTDDDEAGRAASPDSHHVGGQASRLHRRRGTKQHRFQGPEWSDNLYFGSPGLANVITEFANMNVTTTASLYHAHLTHPMPVTRGVDMYAPRDLPRYPFATIFSWSVEECVPQLLDCLPPKDELFGYLESFQKRVHVCFFPHIPTEITESEVERFLSDPHKNTEKCPDMLALLFAALALGSQHSVYNRSGEKWVAGAMKEASARGDTFIAAAMQALRMASYMNRPTLLGIQALIMMGPYLTNSGRFLDAWTLFGTTIRLAQSIGLHRHPKYLDPAPATQRECNMRQSLWWWMLHMDQQYSMTLGRPLGISGIGDCPPPYELTTDQTCLRFGVFVHQFTVLARHILSSDRLTTAKIDEFTDSLRKLLDTLPIRLQFNESWLSDETDVPEWPLGAMAAVFYCKTHNYLILLNRRRIDKKTSQSVGHESLTPAVKASPSSFSAVNDLSSRASRKRTLRGRPLVLSSSEDLLTAFLFFYRRIPAALVCWTIGQQAFNSCMILILDALETGDIHRIRPVEEAYAVFVELDKKGVHKLASLAVERISWGLHQLLKQVDARRACLEKSYSKPPMATGMTGSSGVVQGASASGNPYGAASCRSEAPGYSGELRDTVMGNTGMLLLEDPGLQAFSREAFSPFTWVMAGDELEAAKSTTANLNEADLLSHQRLYDHKRQGENVNGMAAMKQGDNCNPPMGSARSSEQTHGGQGSATAAAVTTAQHFRYTTYANESPVSGPSSTSPQSQSHSQSQSRMSPTTPSHSPEYMSSTTRKRHQDSPPVPQSGGFDFRVQIPQPPHLPHHSYPSIPTLHANPGRQDDQTGLYQSLEHGLPLCNTSSASQQQAGIPNTTIPDTSSSRLGHLPLSQTPLQVHAFHGILPEFSAQPAPSVHSSWAARPTPTTTLQTHLSGSEFGLEQGDDGMGAQEHAVEMSMGYHF